MKIFISIFLVLIFLCITSKIKINVKYIEKGKKVLTLKFNINIGIYLFGVIKIFGITLKEDGIHFLFWIISYNKLKIEKDVIKDIKDFSIFSILKNSKLYIEKLNLNLEIGCEFVELIVFMTSIISIIFSCLLGLNISHINGKKVFYKIIPNYSSNVFNLNVSLLISIKMMNVLKTIHLIQKSRKTKRNVSIKVLPLKT